MSTALQELVTFYNAPDVSIRPVLVSNMLHEMCAGINPKLMYLMKCVPYDEKAFDSVDVSSIATELKLAQNAIKEILVSVRHSLDRVTDLQREILWNYEQTLKTPPAQSTVSTGSVAAGNAAMFSRLSGTSSLLTI